MVVDGTRIRDKMEVAPTADIQPPRFSVELLRNDDGISLIGLVPASTGHERLTENLSELVGEGH
ncbi:MAG: hypothetical protein R3D84_10725 [Paracoccaceae bacterium]